MKPFSTFDVVVIISYMRNTKFNCYVILWYLDVCESTLVVKTTSFKRSYKIFGLNNDT